jgi:hypothetical protein
MEREMMMVVGFESQNESQVPLECETQRGEAREFTK